MAVISLGGSIVVPKPNEIDRKFLVAFQRLILGYVKNGWPASPKTRLDLRTKQTASRGGRFVITVGGGKINRHYNETARSITKVKDLDLDWLGIAVTKLNAELLRVIFSSVAYPEVIANPNTKIKTKKPIIIGSGWLPGCSTDKDAVLWAKNIGTKIVLNLSNIDYVYDKDPNKFSDAKPLEKLSWDEYRNLIGGKWIPRMNVPFDPLAARLAKKFGLKVVFLNGRNLQNLKNFLAGKKFVGTVIS